MAVDPSLLVLIALVVGFVLWLRHRQAQVRAQLPQLLERGAAIVAVRTPAEFADSANPRSINMPLAQLKACSAQLDKDKPVIVCCASGTRSAAAARMLRGFGFREVVNAGPWTNTVV